MVVGGGGAYLMHLMMNCSVRLSDEQFLPVFFGEHRLELFHYHSPFLKYNLPNFCMF